MIGPSIALLATAAIAAATPFSLRDDHNSTNTNQSMVFSFAEVPISADIQWTPCFENFTCANLEVPLDYEDLEAGTTHVAFMKLAATNQPAKGDILLNPGGPANPGANANFLNSVVPLLGTSYNLIGMDPRGVNNSGPPVNCFPDAYQRDYFNQFYWLPNLDATDESSRQDFWLTSGALSDWCSKSKTNNHTFRYINTPAVAHDMLHYAEKLAECEGKNPSEALVNYYGVSYGTLLGATFAKLFPNRLGRFIIDGIADVEDYYSGRWTTGILQSDEALESFFIHCFEAGPKCKFFRNDTSVAAMQERFDAILADIEENPIVFTDETYVQYPAIVKAIDVRGFVLAQLYKFLIGFPILDNLFSGLEENRNATALMYLWESTMSTSKGKVPSETTHIVDASPVMSRLTIICNDMNKRYNISSPEEYGKYVQKQGEVSKYFGAAWASLFTVNCWNWQLTPPESQVFPAEFGTTRTNNPILLTGNTIDPVSSSQKKMASFFPSSRILLQDGVGHGALAVPSTCTSGHIAHFLETGELPPEGVICPVDARPFDAPVV